MLNLVEGSIEEVIKEVNKWMDSNRSRLRFFSFKEPDLDFSICKHPWFSNLVLASTFPNNDRSYSLYWRRRLAAADESDAVYNVPHLDYMFAKSGLIRERLDEWFRAPFVVKAEKPIEIKYVKPEHVWEIGPFESEENKNRFNTYVLYQVEGNIRFQMFKSNMNRRTGKLYNFELDTEPSMSYVLENTPILKQIFKQILNSLNFKAAVSMFDFLLESTHPVDETEKLLDLDTDDCLFKLVDSQFKDKKISHKRIMLSHCTGLSDADLFDIETLGIARCFSDGASILRQAAQISHIEEEPLPELECNWA